MDISLIIGVAIIAVAYLVTWAFIIRANRIINKIDETGIRDSRDIEKALDL